MNRVYLFKLFDDGGNIIPLVGHHALPFATIRAAVEYVMEAMGSPKLQWHTTLGYEEGDNQVLSAEHYDPVRKRIINIEIRDVMVRE